MRDFGAACGDTALQMAIAELDTSGFAGDGAGVWKGDVLWTAFRDWQSRAKKPKNSSMGNKPDLYAG